MMDRATADRLERAQRGDIEAFAEVFEGLRPLVYAVACRLAGPDDAEDVVMDTYLKAWKALPRFRQGSSLRTWLYRISHNCALDYLRNRKRKAETHWDDAPSEGARIENVPDGAQRSPAEAMSDRETGHLLTRAMARLSPEHRTSLELRFADEMSYAEIAAATGVSIGTVMSRLFNAKRRLKTILAELQPGGAEPEGGRA
jgi:RNA polymerase sigma-70 factor (ECF subfamily)